MKKIFVLISLLLVLNFAFAADSLFNYGFEGITLNGSEQRQCYSFDADFTENETTSMNGILSVRAEFIGKDNDNSYVLTKIDGEEKIIWPENFDCDEGCWARVFIPQLKYSITNVELCLITGGATKNAQVFSDSTIGLYPSPVLLLENNSPEKIFLGQRAELKTTIKNVGSRAADIFVQFVGEDTRAVVEISSFDIVEGDTKATTTIKAGETKVFSYFIKPNLTSSYNLPSSVLTFTNIFGEEQKIVSNHPSMEVIDPNQADILIISEGLKEGVFNFKVKVTNNWPEGFEGKIKILPNDLVESPESVVVIPGKGEGEFSFQTKTLEPGNYSISATLLDGNLSSTTKSISFEVSKTDFMFEIVLAIIGGIIALVIFLVIYFWKD
ncbi:MAG: hypothetical protein HON47_01610 [Candidatus Diapherotrites archaeon]|jgi:hypothetical protein|uniref:CARDB domain-containing protein n=1 Tax=Candidatus Iainarchaeum sp. TaxID=3101447 RepID=A0A8T5GE66_9ARCH|nr:hypothetical protein [Candidatus Diapherotrites archaeon]MBT7241689.1 hypothetical protein [Candidatus Diapherotrites archaeon]